MDELKEILANLLEHVDDDCPQEFRSEHLKEAIKEAREILNKKQHLTTSNILCYSVQRAIENTKGENMNGTITFDSPESLARFLLAFQGSSAGFEIIEECGIFTLTFNGGY